MSDHDEVVAVLARIDERTIRIDKALVKLNGRMEAAERDISNLRVKIAFWFGGAAALGALLGIAFK